MHTETSTTTKLLALRNRGTSYELVVSKGDTTLLVCYVARNSFKGVLDAVFSRSEALVNATGATEIEWDRSARTISTDNGWDIRLSGRTQRDAVCNGELSYIGNK